MRKEKKGATLDGVAATVGGLVVSVKEIGEMIGFVVENMATKDDIAEIRKEMTGMATKNDLTELRKEVKGDMFGLLTHINAIETDIREIKHERLTVRVADLEEKVFGRSRS